MKMDWMGDHVPFIDLVYKKAAPAGELKVPEHEEVTGKKKKTYGVPHLLMVPSSIQVTEVAANAQQKETAEYYIYSKMIWVGQIRPFMAIPSFIKLRISSVSPNGA